MKKKTFLKIFSQILLVNSLFACNNQPISKPTTSFEPTSNTSSDSSTKSTEENKLKINVDLKPLYVKLNESILLPKATASDNNGNDISNKITLTIKIENEIVFTGLANNDNYFTPTSQKDHLLIYSLVNNNIKADDVLINLYVQDPDPVISNSKPIITLDTNEENYYLNDTIYTKIASSYDEEDGDISDKIIVKVLDDNAKIIFSGNGNQRNLLSSLQAGTYKVIYDVKDEKELSADSKFYILTVVNDFNIAPTITAPSQNYNIFKGEEFIIPMVNAYDEEDGDLSNSVKFNIIKKNGEIYQNKTSITENTKITFNEADEYVINYFVTDKNGLDAESKSFKIIVKETSENGLVLDGIVNEKEYIEGGIYKCGVSNNTSIRYFANDNGLYIGAEVKDNNLILNNKETNTEKKFNTSDGLEFNIDPFDSNKLVITNTKARRIRISLDGDIRYYVSNAKNDQWTYQESNLKEKVKIITNGTITSYGDDYKTTASALDEDQGYSMEMFLTWEDLGYSSSPWTDENYKKEYIKFNVGQRDILNSSIYNSYNILGTANNIFNNGTATNARNKVASEGLNPSQYTKLYLKGENKGFINCNNSDDNVILDGMMENGFWKNAKEVYLPKTYSQADSKAKVKATKNGIYLGLYCYDSNIIARNAMAFNKQSIFTNDSFDIRVVTNDEMSMNTLPQATKLNTNSKIFATDAGGNMMMEMLNPTGNNRNIAQLPFKYGMSIDGTVGYSKNNDNYSQDMYMIADTNINDTDLGWGVEIFVPWESVGMQKQETGNEVSFKVLFAIYDRGSDAPNNVNWTYSYADNEKISISSPSNPSSYYLINDII